MSNIIPIPRVPVSVRPATLDDLAFIDALQKKQSKQVGWMATKTLEGKINAGHVLLAEGRTEDSGLRTECEPLPPTQSSVLSTQSLGYCIGSDRYFKHDDVGIIYQLNVVPDARRKLVGAMLIQAMFERAAYGCKLFCCWCAQDIEANRFWESIGFVPLAFRSGSAKKARTHIFWQKRIREGDVSTPYWFPSQTNAGAIREDRLVLPIPPGTHWSDVKPLILPADPAAKALPGKTRREAKVAMAPKHKPALGAPLWFAPPTPAKTEKPKAAKKPKLKNDPAHVAAARELRDRYLEQFNAGLVLPGGKYELSRQIGGRIEQPSQLLLEG